MTMPIVDEWSKKANENKEHLDVWEKIVPDFNRVIPRFRMEILDTYFKDVEAAVTAIANTDALAGLPPHLDNWLMLKEQNDKEFEEFCRKKLDLDLAKVPVCVNKKDESQTILDHFQPYLGKNIVDTFEQFIFNEIKDGDDLQKMEQLLTQAVIDKKIAEILKDVKQKMRQVGAKNLEKHEKELERYLITELFLSCVIRAFIGSDNAQKMYSFWEKKKFWETYSNVKLRKPFKALAYVLKHIEIPDDKQEAWHEANLYLIGFYQRVYRKMPKEGRDKNGNIIPGKDGLYYTVDKQDADLKSWFGGLTKYNIVLLYQEMCANIGAKLIPREKVKRTYHGQPRKQHLKLDAERDNDEVALPKRLTEYTQYERKKNLSRLRDPIQEKLERAFYLRKFMDTDELLTRLQVVSILWVKKEIITACHTYLNENRGIFTLWSERIHAGDARTLLKNLQEMEDPQEMLQAVFPYIEKLKNDRSSHFIFGEKGLLNVVMRAYDTLQNGIPPDLLNKPALKAGKR